jgi:CheY-like chemotaxis protein/anti-sigma regulatory factor (Ser/Thr protein kinase)
MKLKRTFKDVLTADDGTVGLDIFKSQRPDIVITDNRMGYMDGIEMIREIREEDPDVPIILVTAYTEKDALVEAINSNVNQFLSKPIESSKMNRAIEKSIQPIINARLREKTLRQELELLKYREKYHSHQELNAFKKELSLIQNDLFLQKYEIQNGLGNIYDVFINIYYKPLDVLSGDIYSIRKLADGSLLIFLADSMGKGLSASVTSILTSAYMNHITDTEREVAQSPLENIIKVFNNYIKGILLDEEILSIIFLKIDFNKEKMEYASFSSPPIFIKKDDGSVDYLRCNNPPLTKFSSDFKTDIADISDIAGILAITDGLYECRTKQGDTVMQKVKDQYEVSVTKTDFHKKMDEIIETPEDDVSCIHILKIPKGFEVEKMTSFTSSLKNVGSSIEWIERCLEELEIEYETASMLTLAYTEMVMNSFEHSVVELDNRKKYIMINNETYDEFINSAESEKVIETSIGIKNLFGKRCVFIHINDEGVGFDPTILKTWMYDKEQSDGKGVKISRRIVDEIYYSSDGRESIIIRILDN